MTQRHRGTEKRQGAWEAHRERLKIARIYIDTHFNRQVTVERVSREAGFSPYHFIRLFRSVYRLTPHQYLTRRRIEQAKTLLRTGNLSVDDICMAVGFESLGSFSTLFRSVTGLSLATYRKRLRPVFKVSHIPSFVPLCYCLKQGVIDSLDP